MIAAPYEPECSKSSGRHFDRLVILLCARWHLAYNLSLRDLEEMMAERGICVDHSTAHRWGMRFSPQLFERFKRRKRSVTGKRHVDETYIRVRGRWMCVFRANDSVDDTVEFFSKNRYFLAPIASLRHKQIREGAGYVGSCEEMERSALSGC